MQMNGIMKTRLTTHLDGNVPDQVGSLSQVGTKRSQKEAGPFWNFLSQMGPLLKFSFSK